MNWLLSEGCSFESGICHVLIFIHPIFGKNSNTLFCSLADLLYITITISRVLVLNQDFSPLMVCSVERAFVLVYLKKSELVKPANGYKLRSVTQSFPMPSVIRLNRYVNAPYKGVTLTRQNIFKRDNF